LVARVPLTIVLSFHDWSMPPPGPSGCLAVAGINETTLFSKRGSSRGRFIERTALMSVASPQIVLIASVFERGFPRESSRLRAVDRIRG
jgi:hypothetical protein